MTDCKRLETRNTFAINNITINNGNTITITNTILLQ